MRQTPDLHRGKKRCGIPGVSRGNPTPTLEPQKGVLHQMPAPVEMDIIRSGVLAVALRRNHWNNFMLLTIRQNGSRVTGLVRQQVLGIYALQSARPLDCNLRPSPRSPTPAPASHARPQPSAASCSAPFCAIHRLIAADRTARMGMDLEMTGVNHQPFIVRLIHQRLQQRPPEPLVPPATEPTMGIFPVSIVWRHITPGSAGTQNPEDRINEPSIILRHPTPTSRSARQMRLQQQPDPVRNVVTPMSQSHESPPRTIE